MLRLFCFSIAANIQQYTSSILQPIIAYIIGKTMVSYFGFGEKVT